MQTFGFTVNGDIKGASHGEFILQQRRVSLDGSSIELKSTDRMNLDNALKNQVPKKNVRFMSSKTVKPEAHDKHKPIKFGIMALPGQAKLYKPVTLRRFSQISQDTEGQIKTNSESESTHL